MHGLKRKFLRIPSWEKERHASWLELLFDLIFAVIITELGTRLFNNFTYLGILECCALFIPVMWTWTSYTVFSTRFGTENIFQWLMTFVVMFSGVIMAIQISSALEEGSFGFTIGFLLSQIALLFLYSIIDKEKQITKKISLFYLISICLGGVFWLVSLFFPSPIKFILWAIGMAIYLLFPVIGRKRILSKAPLHPVYLPERFGAFTIIILGQTIASTIYGLKTAHWNAASVATSIFAFILAIIIWGQYSKFTQLADLKRNWKSMPYIYSHIPLILSLIILGTCAEVFIVQHQHLKENVNLIFSIAVVLYLISFYFLQHTIMSKHKSRTILLILVIIAILVPICFEWLPIYLGFLALDLLLMLLFVFEYMQHAKEIKT